MLTENPRTGENSGKTFKVEQVGRTPLGSLSPNSPERPKPSRLSAPPARGTPSVRAASRSVPHPQFTIADLDDPTPIPFSPVGRDDSLSPASPQPTVSRHESSPVASCDTSALSHQKSALLESQAPKPRPIPPRRKKQIAEDQKTETKSIHASKPPEITSLDEHPDDTPLFQLSYSLRGENVTLKRSEYPVFLGQMLQLFKMFHVLPGINPPSWSMTDIPHHAVITLFHAQTLGVSRLHLLLRNDLYIVGITLETPDKKTLALAEGEQYHAFRHQAKFTFIDTYNTHDEMLCSRYALIGAYKLISKLLSKPDGLSSTEFDSFRSQLKIIALFISEATRFERIEEYCKKIVASEPCKELPWSTFRLTVTSWTALSAQFIENLQRMSPSDLETLRPWSTFEIKGLQDSGIREIQTEKPVVVVNRGEETPPYVVAIPRGLRPQTSTTVLGISASMPTSGVARHL